MPIVLVLPQKLVCLYWLNSVRQNNKWSFFLTTVFCLRLSICPVIGYWDRSTWPLYSHSLLWPLCLKKADCDQIQHMTPRCGQNSFKPCPADRLQETLWTPIPPPSALRAFKSCIHMSAPLEMLWDQMKFAFIYISISFKSPPCREASLLKPQIWNESQNWYREGETDVEMRETERYRPLSKRSKSKWSSTGSQKDFSRQCNL